MENNSHYTVFVIGGIVAFATGSLAIIEISLTFFPGGNESTITILGWYTQLQTVTFMGLRNLGLLNIFMVICGIPLYWSLQVALGNRYRAMALLAMILNFIGATVFLSSNSAFPMLTLSRQYLHATSTSEQNDLFTAGRILLSMGQGHTAGTFIGFALGETAGILMSLIMLKSRSFSKFTSIAGISGFTFLLLYEVLASFFVFSENILLVLATLGGLATIIWLITLGIRLLHNAAFISGK